MSTTQKLVSALDAITATGKFTSCGDTPFFLPEIFVHEEELAFPLPPSQIKHLISLAEQAPYGKGHETVLDDAVRKSWQIDAKHIQFKKNGKWSKYIKNINAAICEDMGIHQPFIIEPYKLLIYEEGGHFRPHTDTEKIQHMFGTLVIALPSKHSGGELRIKHAGEEVNVQFDSTTQKNFQHAAFFSDCEHEVKPVTSGYRVCLTYNIAFKKKPAMKLNQSISNFVPHLTDILTQLKPELVDSQKPLRAILLNHQYTEEHFSFAALKNEDYTKAKALMTAAEDAGYVTHLGLVTLYQMGELDGFDFYDDGYDDCSNADESIGEIYDESLTINNWLDSNNNPVNLGAYHIHPSVFIPETNLKLDDPDEKESEGYTGNAGCTMEYWYRRAAIVLWPKESLNTVLCQYNIKGAADTFLNYQQLGLSAKAAESLGCAILKQLALSQNTSGLAALPIIETAKGICKLHSRVMLDDCFKTFTPNTLSKIDEATWKKLLKTFGHSHFTPYFEHLSEETIASNSHIFIPPLHALLSQSKDAPLLNILASCIRLHDFTQSYTYSQNQASTTIDTETLHLMIAASGFVKGADQRKILRAFILHDLSLDYIRKKLGEALLDKKHAIHFSHRNSFHPSILKRVVAILEKELANAVDPYPDWTRPYKEMTHTSYNQSSFFSQLQAFCLDPDLKSTNIKARAQIRDSIEGHIQSCQLDLNCKTIKQGAPYTLKLTKNSNSYKRALKTQTLDRLLLKKLRQGMR